MYRLGWPLSLLFAKIGIPILIKVEIIKDNEAGVYVATSPDLKGLVVEAETLDELEKEVCELVPQLLELDYSTIRQKSKTHLSFIQPLITV